LTVTIFQQGDRAGMVECHGIYNRTRFVTTLDRDYYARRVREERARQGMATTPSAAKAHAELAEEYERKLETFEADTKG
jgi:hypothetical protein